MIPRLSSSSANEFRQAKESNVYSSHEVMLLNWMNHHFEKEGQKLYGSSKYTMLLNIILIMTSFFRYCVTYNTNI